MNKLNELQENSERKIMNSINLIKLINRSYLPERIKLFKRMKQIFLS